MGSDCRPSGSPGSSSMVEGAGDGGGSWAGRAGGGGRPRGRVVSWRMGSSRGGRREPGRGRPANLRSTSARRSQAEARRSILVGSGDGRVSS